MSWSKMSATSPSPRCAISASPFDATMPGALLPAVLQRVERPGRRGSPPRGARRPRRRRTPRGTSVMRSASTCSGPARAVARALRHAADAPLQRPPPALAGRARRVTSISVPITQAAAAHLAEHRAAARRRARARSRSRLTCCRRTRHQHARLALAEEPGVGPDRRLQLDLGAERLVRPARCSTRRAPPRGRPRRRRAPSAGAARGPPARQTCCTLLLGLEVDPRRRAAHHARASTARYSLPPSSSRVRPSRTMTSPSPLNHWVV